MNRTTVVKESDIERKWYVVDADGVPLGRLAAQVAQVLRGKHKPMFAYNMDCGDFVIVVNAEKVALTGNKEEELLHHHTGWPGGLRSTTRGKMLADKPVKLVEKVIWGMTPKTRLGRQIIKKLKVYAGPDHPHQAQSPEPLKIGR
ncbi:MAG: 50S ribosomal protein L13 [Armatimonadetes bacterium]|uniref:Large ribosomal subunit protein uL13 n=1 Tax=Candidatus Nitrosymbiomonas proteolyticus TaxID=2608984 RepID=A0A809SCZ1_9BACT|nr:MAG: 50S ribosomal protein L13 [Armatimonadota bacterium]KXK13763.1 MAG: 50S ribosomal protein L13 [Armatimonadetes bacterium OLB18]MBV6491946.1 50S ribosomal protein L13 [Fimbriimonadaceae bacterium]QOJ10823.1 MAG: 50S ribosomal protein L13 [Chthonomonadaceae bacterium]BBO22634.1 50S ribosomal protein L13 [Candidatus Nitrosymbiomonas proteolyticus]